MPELTAHSIPASPLPPSPYVAPHSYPPEPPAPPLPERSILQPGFMVTAASPLVIDPTGWEDFAVFRETFLMHVTPLAFSAALRAVGEMLLALTLDTPAEWPSWTESATRTELRAAAADLRHLEGFLGSVGREHAVSSLSRPDDRLSRFPARQAAEVAKIAHRIEEELAKLAAREGQA